jgi:hypothetical protein
MQCSVFNEVRPDCPRDVARGQSADDTMPRRASLKTILLMTIG